jgi:hypothetical protein
MKYLSLFDDFTKVDESYNFDSDGLLEAKINQMSSLRENCMAAWDFSEFKNFFGGSLNENNTEGQNQSLLEQAYYTYELGVLYENNQDWFTTKGEIFFLSDERISEGHVILFKNNRLHIVKESTLERLKQNSELILEGFWGAVGDFVSSSVKTVGSAVKKYVVEPAKKAAAYVGKKVTQAWDALSSGAKAVWEFSKKIVSAIGAFIKENPLTAIGIGLQILATIVSFIPAAGTAIAPILTMMAGAITVYEGVNNLMTAAKETAGAKKVLDIVKGGAKTIFGSASLILGIKDLISATADALPGMGSVGVAIKTSVSTWTSNFTKTAFGGVAAVGIGKTLGCSKWLAEFFSTLCEKAPFMAKIADKSPNLAKGVKYLAKGADAGADKGKEAVLDHEEYHEEWDETINEGEGGSWGFGELLINFLAYVGKSCFNWLYNTVVSGIGMVGKAINGLLDLPGRITKGIDTFKKNYGGSFVGGIISGALSSAVRPLTSCSQRFLDEYIKPKVKPVTGWMTSLAKRNQEIGKKIDGNKELKSPVPGIKEQGPPKIVPKKVDVTAKDKALVKKIGVTGTKTLVKAGGGSEKILDKMKKSQDEFKKKFPAVSKLKGNWGQSPSGKSTYTYKSKEAEGTVTLFNDGKYTVISGPNKKARGEFQADKGVNLNAPKDGWKKNESGFNYLTSFDTFLAS